VNRKLLLALALVAVSTAAVAETTIVTTSRHCSYTRSRISGNQRSCHTDVEVRLPPRPRPIVIEPPRPVLPPTAQRDPGTGVVVMRGMPTN
jgi:hypothetical protein